MTPPSPTRREAVAAAGLLTLAAAACSGPGPAQPAATTTPAAEPPSAPSPATAPAGTTASAGYAAEGIVRDPATGLVAVGVRRPNRLLVLDPDTLDVVRSLEVPGTIRHLAVSASGGTVLVPNEAADSLTEVDLGTGSLRETPVGHVPHDAYGAPNGDVLVSDEFGRSLTVVREGRVVHRVEDLQQPGGVVATDTTALVVDVGAFTLTGYTLDGMERVARVPAGAGPTHVVRVGPDRVAVADTRGGRLLVFTVQPLRQVASISLDSAPYGLAVDPDAGTVWVTLPARNEVVGVDVTPDGGRVVARHPTIGQPNTVATDAGSRTVWVASRTEGTVQRIRT
jgi:DNA-binding beta-propeller fold protein YncE